MQAHGRTAEVSRPISYEAMGDDIACPDETSRHRASRDCRVFTGARTALYATIRHPTLIKKLVAISTPCKRTGWYSEILAAMDQMGPAAAEMMKPSPLYQTYAPVAPHPEDWTKLVTKVADLLRQDYDWSPDVAEIKAPILLVFGGADAVRPEHIVECFQLLGDGKKDAEWDRSGMSNARLAILPAVTHYNMAPSAVLKTVIETFLNETKRV